ncbi:hypothetical protein PIB30_055253 [Stylosanthes scabra]|uniref:Uncharacterized protein n=1 Tax=Stylosanthes scabra TaxID=79078 RepID=A0ABU6XGT6_9FABA|nr:hypothetical protein [Stylosanthes scabra]
MDVRRCHDGTTQTLFFATILRTVACELRLTHGLRLREALVILFTIVTHAKHGCQNIGEMVVEMTQFGVENGRMVLGYSLARKKSRVSIELGVQNRFFLFKIDSKESRGACGANDSAYGNSGPSGVVSVVGSLFPRGTKANVAAYGSGRGLLPTSRLPT